MPSTRSARHRGRTGRATILLALCVGWTAESAAAQQGSASAYYEYLMARRLESAGNTDAALAALERAAAADPTSAEIRAEIASLYLRRNPPQREAGEKAAKAALALDEKNAEANRALGFLYANAVDLNARNMSPQMATYLRDAITHLERAQAGTTGTDINLLFRLGQLYIASGEPPKAVQALTRVVLQNPGNPQARRALAQAYASGGDLKSAIGTLEEIVEYLPSVGRELGEYQERAGMYREAAASFTVAILANPNNRQLKLDRIRALYAGREYAQAAAFAAEARKQHPEDLRFVNFQARALFDAGDRSGALTLAEANARAFPREASTQITLADLYSDAGRDADAERTLRQVLAADPGNANVLNTLGYMLAVRGEQLDEAISLVRRALEKDPENGAFLDSLGWAHFRRGDFAEAQKYLDAAAERLPQNSEVLDHLGDVYARRGQIQQAIDAWKRALSGDLQGIDKASVERKLEDAQRKLTR